MLKSTEKSIEIVWNYLQLHQDPTDSDAMIVLGSRDDRVAAYAAQLAAKHNYGNIVISGGVAHKMTYWPRIGAKRARQNIFIM